MAKKTAKISEVEMLEPRIYEIGYLLSPAIRDEDLEARATDLKESLIKLGGSIISEGNPEFIDLAYEMSRVIENKRVRFTQGYFGWFKIEIDPSKMTEAKEILDKNTLLIRYLLIGATAENTVIGKKSLGKILKGSRKHDDAEVAEGVLEGETGLVPEEEIIPAEKLEEVLDEEIKELVKES
jgi:ribosomal protein S6